MAKKKRRSNLAADSRGYNGQQTTASSSVAPVALQQSTVSSSADECVLLSRLIDGSSSSDFPFTASTRSIDTSTTPEEQSVVTHQDLDDDLSHPKRLSDLPDPPPSSSSTELGPPSDNNVNNKRFFRRLSNIYDRLVGDLTEEGCDYTDNNCRSSSSLFTHQQFEKVVVALGYDITIESALDWLCTNIHPLELPPLFAEQKLILENGTKDSSLLEVLCPETNMASVAENSKTISTDDVIAPSTQPMNPSRLDENESTKDWIVQQYRYDGIDTHESNACSGRSDVKTTRNVTPFNKNEIDVSPSREISRAPLNDPVTVERNDRSKTQSTDVALDVVDDVMLPCAKQSKALDQDPPMMLLEEQALQQARLEMQQLEWDVNDDASNYMRSKYEIQQLRQKLKALRKNVAGLERKVEKQRSRQELTPPNAETLPSDEAQHTDGGEVGFFDLFDEAPAVVEGTTAAPGSTDPSTGITAPSIEFPNPIIPKSWTGKTPQQLLLDFCLKHKRSKPTYAFDRDLCTVRIPSSKNRSTSNVTPLESVVPGPFRTSDQRAAKEYVATQLLYQFQSDYPIHRLLPPYFADLWRGWKESEQSAQQKVRDAQQKTKDQVIRDLIQLIADTNAERDVPSSTIGGQVVTDARTGRRRKNGTEPGSLPTEQDDRRLQNMFQKQCDSKQYQAMLQQRSMLPIFPYRNQILDTIDRNAVTVICAETGAGKTTNCGQFILEQTLQDGGAVASLLCTQPRRVAATSVAERVAEEMGEPSLGKLVGYQIRLESRKSADTRLLFCTTGVVLRRLVEDPALRGVTHVLVDEVHERQWQIDVLLILLRNLLQGPRPDLKVVLMSATLDAKLFCEFFGGAPLVSVPGRTFPVSSYYLEDILEETGQIIEEGSMCAFRLDRRERNDKSLWVTNRGGEKRRETHSFDLEEDISGDFPGYSISTQRSMDRVDETIINYDLIEDLLTVLLLKGVGTRKILHPPPDSDLSKGSVLIFLPGIGEIRTLTERLEGSHAFGRSGAFEIIPMHSTLSSADQRRAFSPPARGRRKIILATNIAETSVTIPDVVCVIDSGRVRELQQNRRTSTPKLVATWCSRASTKQRAGRAGRVQPGMCLKLFSSKTEHRVMGETSEPELTRIPLQEVCLSILATGLAKGCKSFLAQAPQPPSDSSVDAALGRLREIGAIALQNATCAQSDNQYETLTPLGYNVAQLPMDARLGKMLIYGALLQCIEPISTIVACLSASKSVFQSGFQEDSVKATKAAQSKFLHPFSDFLTLVNVYEAFLDAERKGAVKGFCHKYSLSLSALREVRETKTRSVELLNSLGFVDGLDYTRLTTSEYNRHGKNESVVHSVVLAGVYPHVGRLCDTGVRLLNKVPVRIQHQSEQLEIHPTSVNRKVTAQAPSTWLAFDEKFGTVSRITVSNTCFVDPLAIALFGRSLEVLHFQRQVKVDRWIELRMAAQTGVRIKQLQSELDLVLHDYYANARSGPGSTIFRETRRKASEIVDAVVSLMNSLQ